MGRLRLAFLLAVAATCVAAPAFAQERLFYIGQIMPTFRAMIGKSMLDQSIAFNNSTSFVLEELVPEGARFFFGGSSKKPGENADDMRQSHDLIVLITPCTGIHDLTAKVSAVAVWERLDGKDALASGVGLEQMLSLMNTPPGVVTPSTLRVPRIKTLHGPVFEYVRGDTTETLSLVNEGNALRINWTSTNTAVCPH